ncbi:MAG: DUF362 domain-containing protein [Candidatus Hermodarchaeota archaeon]
MSTIYFTNNLDRNRFVAGAFSRMRLKLQGKILIKVNLVSHNPYPTTTHPDMIEAVYNQVKSDASEIICGDGHGVDVSSQKLKNHPVIEKCHELGIPFVDFYDHSFRKVKTSRNYTLNVSELPFQQDFIISLPILKDHYILNMTNALKDKFGYLAKTERIKMHAKFKSIDKGIAELNAIIKSNLIICDAIKVMIQAQELRHGGIEKDLGYIFAGTDPIALDYYGFKVLQPISIKLKDITDPAQIQYVKYALDYGIGSRDYNLEEIEN